MRLRNLELKDAPLMLEWMHDESVVGKLKGNFIEKTLADAESFILASANKKENIHLAIVSDENEYMGTVSLKNVEDGIENYVKELKYSKNFFNNLVVIDLGSKDSYSDTDSR